MSTPKTDTRNYYERELDKIDFTGEHSASVLFGSQGTTTKALAVNAESAAAIIRKLAEVFLVPHADPAPVEETENRVGFSVGRDRNGNKTLKVHGDRKSFTIQTNGNLPQTHRDNITARTSAEVRAYISEHGTARQKAILGL